MDQVTLEKKTVEEAVAEALEILCVSRDDVVIEVLQEPQKGLFGLLGGKEARVRVTRKPAAAEEASIPTGVEKAQACGAEEGLCGASSADAKPPADGCFRTTCGCEIPVSPSRPEEPTQVDRPEHPVEHGDGLELEPSREVVDDLPSPLPPSHAASASSGSADGKCPASTVAPAEDFSTEAAAIESARAYLEQIMHLMGYDGKVEVIDNRPEDENITLDILPDDYKMNARFIGKKGDTLSALGYLMSIYFSRRYSGELRIEVDCGDYIYDKKEDLKSFARSSARRALERGEVVLRPMSAYERRIVHKVLTEIEGVHTHSEGEEPGRRVVITRDPQ